MGYILLALFLIIAILCYLEDYIRKYQKSLFFLIGLVLILWQDFEKSVWIQIRKITNIHSRIISRMVRTR